MKTSESSESIKDVREPTEYQQKKFNFCEPLAKEFLITKPRTKGYRFTCYDLRFEEDEVESDTYLRLTDEQVASLKAYMIEVNNRMYPEEQVSSWEEFVYERLEVNGSEYWEEINDTPGLWKELVSDRLEGLELRPKMVEFNDWNYGYEFSCFIYDEEKKEMEGPYHFLFHLTDEEYVFLLTLQLSEPQGFTYNRLAVANPGIVDRLNTSVEKRFLEIENLTQNTRPFIIIFDEIIADAKQLEEKMSSLWVKYIMDNSEVTNETTKPYTFKVWIDGNYYLDDEEFEKEIPLSEKEVATIKSLIDDYEGNLGKGLMPILKTGPKKLYKKFYDVIYPKVFMYLFDVRYIDEVREEDEGRHWGIEDFDYLNKTYGNGFYFDESYIVYIPEDWIPSKIHLSKGMSDEDIIKYIRRWNSERNTIYEEYCSRHHPSSKAEQANLYEYIEQRLLAIAKKQIEESDDAILGEDDYNPFLDLYIYPDKEFEEFFKDYSSTCQ